MAYSNMKKDYTALAMMQAMDKGTFEGAVDITLTWYRKDRRSDPDNVAGGIKFLLDGFVKAGLLKNDGFKQVNSITHYFGVDKDNPRVDVELISNE